MGGPHSGEGEEVCGDGLTDTPSLPAGSSSMTYRVVLGKQVLSEEDEPGSLAVGVEKTIVHENWNSFFIM